MACHIYDLCTTWKDWLSSQQRDTAHQFLNILKAEKFQIFSPNSKLTDAQLVQLNDVSVLQKKIGGCKGVVQRPTYFAQKQIKK